MTDPLPVLAAVDDVGSVEETADALEQPGDRVYVRTTDLVEDSLATRGLLPDGTCA